MFYESDKLCQFVIANDRETLYWNNAEGWAVLEMAEIYSYEEMKGAGCRPIVGGHWKIKSD